MPETCYHDAIHHFGFPQHNQREGKVYCGSKIQTKTTFQHDLAQVNELLEPFKVGAADVQKVMLLLEENMNAGLGRSTNKEAQVKMFPSYVRSLPDGTESGKFLALDLGGTNFRVLLVNLFKDSKPDIISEVYSVSESLMTGPGTELFDHIADCIKEFLGSKRIQTHAASPLPLGFTFSFPCQQQGLDKGVLKTWTKGFSCPGVEGNDVVALLESAIDRKPGLHVRCLAILNDTVGTLVSCAYEDPRCEIGLILGTGTNACYMEHLERVEQWQGDRCHPQQVIINTEWGAFGGDGCLDFLQTEYDVQMDEESMFPGKQIYEKMISGMYLGEIARLALVKLVHAGCLFEDRLTHQLEDKSAFPTKYISEVESEPEGEFSCTRRILDSLQINNASDEECAIVRQVCEAVSRRAAVLVSAGLAVLLNRLNKKDVTVGVDGSLFKYHTHFRHIMTETIQQLIQPDIQFRLVESHDGSGKGAALVAAVAQRMHYENRKLIEAQPL